MTENKLEKVLKSLLERIINETKLLLRTKQDLKELQPILQDYEDTLQLSTILSSVADLYFRKAKERLQTVSDDDYRNLEKLLQKNEGQNRQHIRAEQQLKLYSDSLQEKLQESELARQQLLHSTKDIITNLKKDNQHLTEEVSYLREQLGKQERVTSRQSNMSDRILQSAKSKRNSSISSKLRQLASPFDSKKRESISYSKH